jgi:hypothetical protein
VGQLPLVPLLPLEWRHPETAVMMSVAMISERRILRIAETFRGKGEETACVTVLHCWSVENIGAGAMCESGEVAPARAVSRSRHG